MAEIQSQRSINPHTNDKFRVLFSNLPSINGRTADIKWLYENFIKSFNLPGYDLKLLESHFRGSTILHPISKNNNELEEFSIDFTADEKLYNYYFMVKFILQHRYGELNLADPAVTRVSQRPETYDYNYDINDVQFLILDNEKRVVNRIEFKNVFPVSISDITFESGASKETNFSVRFKYREMLMDLPSDL